MRVIQSCCGDSPQKAQKDKKHREGAPFVLFVFLCFLWCISTAAFRLQPGEEGLI
jgi:hypothetical protein